jgi:hypothetical protein
VFLIPPFTNWLYGTNEGHLGDFGSSKSEQWEETSETSKLLSQNLDIGSYGVVYYQQRGVIGWSVAKKAELMIQHSIVGNAMLISEIDSNIVHSFNVSSSIQDMTIFDLDIKSNGTQSLASESPNNINDKTVIVNSGTFSIKITASSAAHAREIKEQIFARKDLSYEKNASELEKSSKIRTTVAAE